jgi:hypothetical protein
VGFLLHASVTLTSPPTLSHCSSYASALHWHPAGCPSPIRVIGAYLPRDPAARAKFAHAVGSLSAPSIIAGDLNATVTAADTSVRSASALRWPWLSHQVACGFLLDPASFDGPPPPHTRTRGYHSSSHTSSPWSSSRLDYTLFSPAAALLLHPSHSSTSTPRFPDQSPISDHDCLTCPLSFTPREGLSPLEVSPHSCHSSDLHFP